MIPNKVLDIHFDMVVYETIDLRYQYAMVTDEKEHIVPIVD